MSIGFVRVKGATVPFRLAYQDHLNKVWGGWMGKSIGGTMGGVSRTIEAELM